MSQPQPTRLSLISADGEQNWNLEALSRPLTAPRFALWRYQTPAVVLGCLQKLPEPSLRSLPIVKRAAGGGAVLVGPWMLSLSLALPLDHPLAIGGLIESYRWLGEMIARVLQDFGIAAQALAPSELPAKDESLSWACFGNLSPWEIVVAGRKIAGLAQRRSANGLLLVAGILIDETDWPALYSAMDRPQDDANCLSKVTTSCHAALGRSLALSRVAAAIELAIDNQLASSTEFSIARPPSKDADVGAIHAHEAAIA